MNGEERKMNTLYEYKNNADGFSFTEGRISVVVPVYNVEKYLDRCVRSVLSQSYAELELILVNDGSTDGSLRICEEYSRQDGRVRVLTIPNSGSAAARNRGMDVMTGEYLMFVDSDDWIEPGALEKALRTIRSTGDDVVIFGVFSGDKPNVTAAEEIPCFDKADVLESILSGETSRYSNRGYYVDGLWSKIYRTGFVQNNHIRFPEKLIRGQDSVFALYITELACSTSFNTFRFYHYEKNADSICNTYSDKSVRIIPEILKENDNFIAKYYIGRKDFANANSMSIFPRFIEADRNYFFHAANPKSRKELYAEYLEVLMKPVVREHILAIDPEKISRNQRLKLKLYRNPNPFLFALYAMIVKR